MRSHSGFTAASIRMGMVVTAIMVATIVAGGVALFLQVRGNMDMTRQLAQVRRELADQAVLYPLHLELVQARKKAVEGAPESVPRRPLPRTAIVDVPERFAKLAAGVGLQIGSVNPRVGHNGGEDRQLHIDVLATGPYVRLRDFLQALMAWPSFLRVDQIEICRKPMHEEFKLRVWLALE